MKLLKQLMFFGIWVYPFCATADEKFKINDIQAFLYYHNQGTFSEDIFSNPRLVEWNATIGEGGAKGPSKDVFLKVLILDETTDKDDFVKDLKIRVIVSSKKHVLLNKQILTQLFENKQYYAGFWVYETGCEKLLVKAELEKNGKIIGEMQKEIMFKCGE